MRFKGTFVLLLVCLALGAYVYFYEIKGGEQREKAKQAENEIWKVENDDIQQIEIGSAGQRIIAARKNAKEWVLTAPRQWDADSDEVNRLAGSASRMLREEIVEQNAADLSKFGLSPAQFSLKLKTKDGKEYALDFGHNNPSGNSMYANIPNQKAVFLVASSAASAFNKKAEDLRDRSILRFEQPEAQTLTLNNSKGILELAKDGNDRWWFAGPDKRAADSPEIRGILNALSMGKIKEFFNENPEDYANTGLDKPFIDVRLTYGKDKALKHLIVGSEKSKLRKKARDAGKMEGKALDPASPQMYLAKDASRPDLFFVEQDFVDKLLKSPNDVRDKALAPFQRWDVDFMLLKNTRGSFSFTKSGGEWTYGEAKKKAKWDAINGILDAVEKPVKEWIDKPAPLAVYGLEKPLIRLVLKQGGTVLADCSFGNYAKKDGIYAQVKGDSSVKVADPDIGILDRAEPDYVEAPAPKK